LAERRREVPEEAAVSSGDLFAGDTVTLRAAARDLAGSPSFEIHAAADDRTIATVSGTLKGSAAEAQWTTPKDFDEAAANDASRAPQPAQLYFVVKLGGKEARSESIALHALRHLNLKLLGAPAEALQVVVAYSGGSQKFTASGQLDTSLRTTADSCTIDFGRGAIEVAFDIPALTEDRGIRLRLASLGYHTGSDDNTTLKPSCSLSRGSRPTRG
jgi:hypothetical protein